MNKEPKIFTEIFNLKINDNVSVNSIEIPIIQRDYAQGRKSKEIKRIRTQFLAALHGALTSKIDPIKLDFVYGNISDGKLIPLDGQQRLTTLFLLHWYIAKKEEVKESEYDFLNNFTYRTRFSSTHFCKSLINAYPDFSTEKLSNWITNQNWYMYSWDNDPTISSMLVMLDDIHSVFKNEIDLWDQITNESNPLISFYFLPLEDMGLTDSLYIKMNSRGKPLTDFEHFKADFEVLIKEVSTGLYNEFIQKVDNDWVDMLWKYRSEDNIIDDEFMRYFRFVTEMICFQKEIKITENNFDLAREVYSNKNSDAKSNLRFLFNAFDCWKKQDDIESFFDSIFSKQNYELNKVTLFTDFNNLFLACCNKYGHWVSNRRAFSLNNTLLLFATLIYQINKEVVSEDGFEQRIRIIRNLVMNSPDEIREDRMQALLNDTERIILQKEINLKNLGFNEIQKNQELEKISWRLNNKSLVESINRLEDHSLLQGNIAIIGLDSPRNFELRVTNFIKLFDSGISYASIRKALLSMGDYSQLASWRFLLGNKNASSWRELFTPSKKRQHFDKTKATLSQLLDSINGDFAEYLKNIIDKYLLDGNHIKDWRYYFIKYYGMRKGNSGVYYWYNDPSKIKENQYEVYMMNTSLSLNGKHWNPFLYILFRDNDFKDMFSLEEYHAPLIINQTAQKIECRNDCWEIYDKHNNLFQTIPINQENGVDTVDRIELMKEELKAMQGFEQILIKNSISS